MVLVSGLLINPGKPQGAAFLYRLAEAKSDRIELLLKTSPEPYCQAVRVSSVTQLQAILESGGDDVAEAIVLAIKAHDPLWKMELQALQSAVPQLPVLALVESDAALGEEALRCGAYDYLLDEEIEPTMLRKALNRALNRKTTEHSLFQSHERAEVTLGSIGDAVIVTDFAGSITYMNKAAESLTGWDGSEADGRGFPEVIRINHPGNPAKPLNPMALAITENKVVRLPPGCRLTKRDGTRIAIDDSASPLHDRRGRVSGAVMVFRDVTHAQELADRVAHLAHHDALTGLPNRLLLEDRLTQAIAAGHRASSKLALLFIDVDRFKSVNDLFGHATGDALLMLITRHLLDGVRASDTVCRQGGDEFLIVLPSISKRQDAARVADKIQSSLAGTHHLKDCELHVSVSIGIAIHPDDGTTMESLIQSADLAMLDAKQRGRNTRRFYCASMRESRREGLAIEAELRSAIERSALCLHYQPQYELRSGNLIGVEALLRWQHERHGLLLPDRFIPVAEKSGFILPLGHWTLREACRQMASWRNAALKAPRVAVNVSAVELRATKFLKQTVDTLHEFSVDPRDIKFELTETALLGHPQEAIDVLTELNRIGIRIALDDFGTGFSSLSYLKQFPIDELKIDKSFVGGLCNNVGDAKIVGAIISMAQSFGLTVIAEGIETRAQLNELIRLGCPQGQGFYLHHPGSASELSGELRSL
jgi:diguanylate cyclase (GGDEF)-like protein/PAS domain S-box-containing protein